MSVTPAHILQKVLLATFASICPEIQKQSAPALHLACLQGCLLCKSCLQAKSIVLKISACIGSVQELGPEGLRLVRLPASELSSMNELGRTLKQHPRVKFVVLCSLADLSSGSASSIISALAGISQLPFTVSLYKCLPQCGLLALVCFMHERMQGASQPFFAKRKHYRSRICDDWCIW